MSRFSWSIVLVLAFVPCACGQGLLQRAVLATHGKPRRPASPPAEGRIPPAEPNYFNASQGIQPGPNAGAAIILVPLLAGAIATCPLWGPYVLLEEAGERGTAYFPGHPYALFSTNYLEITKTEPDNSDRSVLAANYRKPFAVQASLEDGNDFSGLNRLSGRFTFDTSSRLGFSTQWDHYHERYQGRTNEVVLGDAHLTCRIAQTDWILMHAGLGGRVLIDRQELRGGFDFIYGADIYPMFPFVLSSQLDVGHINRAFVLRLRNSLGVQLRRAELFLGYDWLRIGDVDLHGPMLGARLSF